MRLVTAMVALWAALTGTALVRQDVPIPLHPDLLRYDRSEVELPEAGNRRVRLPAGPVVYLAEDHSLPLVEISLALRVGSFLEAPEQTGLAFLTGSLVRRGGTVHLQAEEFDNQADQWGAQIHSMSGGTRTGASLSIPSWVLEPGLELFFSMIAQPAFQEDRLQLSQGNLLESLSRRNESALDILEREWEWLMYGSTHFSTRPLTSASLPTIERSDLVAFHQRYWRPEEMILAISGDFDRQSLLADLENRFAAWPTAGPNPIDPAWPPPSPGSSVPPGLYHYEMDVPQAKVILGHRLSQQLDWLAEDRFALAIVAEILGGSGAISRIAGRLRTGEGLVYRASAELDPGLWWPGDLRIFFETRGSSVARAVAAVLEELERLQREDVHPMELAVVQRTLESRLRLDFDTAEEISGYFAEDELLGRPHSYWRQYLAGISSVDSGDIRRIANTYLQPEALVYLAVGRWTEIAGEKADATTVLESVTGHPRTPLPRRDPLTMKIEVKD